MRLFIYFLSKTLTVSIQSTQLSLLFSAPSRQFCAVRAVQAKAKLCLLKGRKMGVCFSGLVLFITFNLSTLLAIAKPFIPHNDSQVLERLSSGPGKPLLNEARKLRDNLNKDPNNLQLALKTAKHFIEIGRQEADPRYFGYAESALKPFLNGEPTSPDILVIKATIHQYNHDFDGALEDLNKALKLDPSNVQAWLTQALILQTQGNYKEAKNSCAHLIRLTNELVSAGCLSSISSLNGQASKSYGLLNQVLSHTNTDELYKNERLWTLTLLGEIGKRLGDYKNSEQYFKNALEVSPNDNYLLATYVDFLLLQKRYTEVISLLKGKTKIDNLLLRLALAEQVIKSNSLASHINELDLRFRATKLRNDTANIHLREEAIFKLKLQSNPTIALALAKRNWEVQKEPLDAQIFLECALALNDKSSTKPVLEFIKNNMLEDKQLNDLVKRLK